MVCRRKSVYFIPGDPCPDPRTALRTRSSPASAAGAGAAHDDVSALATRGGVRCQCVLVALSPVRCRCVCAAGLSPVRCHCVGAGGTVPCARCAVSERTDTGACKQLKLFGTLAGAVRDTCGTCCGGVPGPACGGCGTAESGAPVPPQGG